MWKARVQRLCYDFAARAPATERARLACRYRPRASCNSTSRCRVRNPPTRALGPNRGRTDSCSRVPRATGAPGRGCESLTAGRVIRSASLAMWGRNQPGQRGSPLMLKVKTSTRREAEAVARGGVSREACKSTEHTSMSGSVSRPKIPFSGPALHLQLAVSLVHMMRWHFCLLHMLCTAQPGCRGCHTRTQSWILLWLTAASFLSPTVVADALLFPPSSMTFVVPGLWIHLHDVSLVVR